MDAVDAGFEPLVSVITIVFNDAKHIGRTLRSVTGQTWKRLEYIVIDGGSSDGTENTIAGMRNTIDVLVQEPDRGIYDAMNKGLARAGGDYVLFMNSGDEFYAADTLECMLATARDADIYYGETEMMGQNLENLGPRRHRAPATLGHSSFRYGMSVSHQAILVRRSITGPFDATFSLSADIDWILRALTKATNVVNTGLVVARYLTGGASKKKHLKSLAERFRIFSRHYGFLPNLFNHLVIAWRLLADRFDPERKKLKT